MRRFLKQKSARNIKNLKKIYLINCRASVLTLHNFIKKNNGDSK